MPKEELARLNGQTVKAIHYSGSPFQVMTGTAKVGMMAGGLLGGGFAAFQTESTGDEMRKDYSLDDPILRVKAHFLTEVRTSLRLDTIDSVQTLPSSSDMDDLRAAFSKGTLFDFQSTNWHLTDYPLGYYRIEYRARARLIRRDDSRVLWEGACNFAGKEPTVSMTLDDFKANNAAILRQSLNEAPDACVQELLSQFLGKREVTVSKPVVFETSDALAK